jgi:hypothetical protein
MSGGVHHLPHMPSWHGQEQFVIYYFEHFLNHNKLFKEISMQSMKRQYLKAYILKKQLTRKLLQ